VLTLEEIEKYRNYGKDKHNVAVTWDFRSLRGV
jgi:hypothetical protein